MLFLGIAWGCILLSNLKKYTFQGRDIQVFEGYLISENKDEYVVKPENLGVGIVFIKKGLVEIQTAAVGQSWSDFYENYFETEPQDGRIRNTKRNIFILGSSSIQFFLITSIFYISLMLIIGAAILIVFNPNRYIGPIIIPVCLFIILVFYLTIICNNLWKRVHLVGLVDLTREIIGHFEITENIPELERAKTNKTKRGEVRARFEKCFVESLDMLASSSEQINASVPIRMTTWMLNEKQKQCLIELGILCSEKKRSLDLFYTQNVHTELKNKTFYQIIIPYEMIFNDESREKIAKAILENGKYKELYPN